MRYLSVCSGLGSDHVAWRNLGWKCVGFSEIAPFQREVLRTRFPEVPLFGDFTTIRKADVGNIDLLIGGTPCQSFSISGKRMGMEDERGNLALEFIRLAERLSPRYIVWENVPGVLSSNGGRDFGSFLGALGHIGYGWAYRVLDAQFFGTCQRRRRVFLVAVAGGDYRKAGDILFDSFTVPWHPSTRSKKRQEVAALSRAGTGDSAVAFDLVQITSPQNRSLVEPGLAVPTLASSSMMHVIVIKTNQTGANGHNIGTDVMFTLDTSTPPSVAYESQNKTIVRRITPKECERLQGLPDDHTAIIWKKGQIASDAIRYKAIGNGMAVPVLSWIGTQIEAAHSSDSDHHDIHGGLHTVTLPVHLPEHGRESCNAAVTETP